MRIVGGRFRGRPLAALGKGDPAAHLRPTTDRVREAIFNQFRDEVPYSTQAVVITYEERDDQKDYIACDIVVERDSQKAILIGKGGTALKRLGQAARQEIEAFLGRSVFLQLYVKTRADWRNKDGHLREYGFGQ